MAKGEIVRRVRVDRTRGPYEMLEATGCKVIGSEEVIADMPRGKGDEVLLTFFKVEDRVSDRERVKIYRARKSVPADPYSLAAVNERYLDFPKPNSTHWTDREGRRCFLQFGQLKSGNRFVFVDYCEPNFDWNKGNRFASFTESP